MPQAKGIQPPNGLVIFKKNKAVKKKKDNWLEMVLKKIQLLIMPTALKAGANKNTSIVLNNNFLKFHDHDKRNFIKNQLRTRVEQILA